MSQFHGWDWLLPRNGPQIPAPIILSAWNSCSSAGEERIVFFHFFPLCLMQLHLIRTSHVATTHCITFCPFSERSRLPLHLLLRLQSGGFIIETSDSGRLYKGGGCCCCVPSETGSGGEDEDEDGGRESGGSCAGRVQDVDVVCDVPLTGFHCGLFDPLAGEILSSVTEACL